MSDNFTYQEENNNSLEYYEWDNLWVENAPLKSANKLLVIGDSISCGYRRIISKIANEKFFVDGIGTSKTVDNPHFIPLIDYFLPQTSSNISAVLFNNGLHGFHLKSNEYEKYYNLIVEFLIKRLPNSKLFIVTTTPARNNKNLNEYSKNINAILERNLIAEKIAKKHNLPVCNLYNVIKDNKNIYQPDGVHLSDEGYEILAKECYTVVEKYM